MSMAVITADPAESERGKRWTAADLREITDHRNRYEIVDGELFVTPSPSPEHQTLLKLFFRHIDSYVEAGRLGNVIFAPSDVMLADDTVVEPDLFVLPPTHGKLPAQWDAAAGLLLVVEILSPRTARADRTVKRQRYQKEGVSQYWLVDGDARVVERWRPEDDRPEILSDRLEWQPDASVQPLAIDLAALFVAGLGA